MLMHTNVSNLLYLAQRAGADHMHLFISGLYEFSVSAQELKEIRDGVDRMTALIPEDERVHIRDAYDAAEARHKFVADVALAEKLTRVELPASLARQVSLAVQRDACANLMTGD